MLTGMVNFAVWHVLSDAVLIEAALGRVMVLVSPAVSASLRPVAFVKVTPVPPVVHAGISDVTAPPPLTAVTFTGKVLGFVTLTLTSAVPPGYSVPVAIVTSDVVTAAISAAFAYPLPEPLSVQLANAITAPPPIARIANNTNSNLRSFTTGTSSFDSGSGEPPSHSPDDMCISIATKSRDG